MTDSKTPWSAPLHLLGSLHTGDVFGAAQQFVSNWVTGHGRKPSDARLQDIVDVRDLLMADPKRLGELHNPMMATAIQCGGLKSIVSVIIAQLNTVIAKLSKLPLDRFVTACAIEMGSQLWMIMRVNDDLVEYGSDAGDVPQVIRESMFGVIMRCRGARLDDQLSLMVDHLRTGMLQFERLTERLGVVFKAKQKDQPNTPTLSEGRAIEILSQLDGDRPNA